MDTQDFEELAGRIDGVARAVLVLAQMMERETDMDGLTLTRQWRESVGPQADAGSLGTARKTLHQMAQLLDDARNRHQESVAAARLADPSLMQHVAQSDRQGAP
ncbi:MAG: hypothetical protein Q8R67_12235 [Rhodoferax sp.]|nr:hypothetical protein [Rhodoferax sp.]MDP3652441.1 hypothetical protein [Rhodoferax sp.]